MRERSGDLAYPLPADVETVLLDTRRSWKDPEAVWVLARHIDWARPDVVVSIWWHASLLTGLSLQQTRHRPSWGARTGNNLDGQEDGVWR